MIADYLLDKALARCEDRISFDQSDMRLIQEDCASVMRLVGVEFKFLSLFSRYSLGSSVPRSVVVGCLTDFNVASSIYEEVADANVDEFGLV